MPFAAGIDPLSSFLDFTEKRRKAWALSLSKRSATTPAVLCGSAVYGELSADGSRDVNEKESANCRNICRALLHK